MDKIKAIIHGTTPEYEKEVKEEKKAEKAEEKQEKKAEKEERKEEKAEQKEEKKAEKHGSHPTTGATHTSNTGDITHRPRDSEFDSTRTGTSGVPSNTTSGLGGVTSVPSGNGLDTHGRDNIGSHGTSHHGRDAALGSGAVGAAGLAEHEHRKHENTGLGSNNQTYGHSEGSHGPHNSAALNAADPRVDSDLDGNRLPNQTSSGYGTKDAYGTNATGSSGHHLGRDAAAVGTAGAVGEGIHHHHNQHNTGLTGGVNGPHQTATANLLDPNLDNSGVRTEGAHTHHGHGDRARGLVEGGGAEEADGVHGAKGTSAAAGVVPVGAYEAGHGHNTTAGPHSSNLANKADPRVDSDLSKQKNHHYGRDAAIAGGVGGAAYEANKHHHNNANTTAGPHSSNLENKADPRVDSDLSKQKNHHYGRDAAIAGGVGGAAYEANKHHHNNANTTAGPHSSNLENKVDPRVDSDRSREQHHYGRDAALTGAAGTAAYEADKHHHHHNTANTTAGPHSSNIENKVDPRVDSDRSKEGHHLGRDAAVAGGAAGTAYEANKHHHTHGTDQKPVGKDIGDKLHGVERNRGVNGPTGFPHESGHSVPTGAVGTGVPGAPRGNVAGSDNTHGHHNSNNIEHPVHNSATGPDHIFTAPVMDDPAANSDLREGKIDQSEHRHGGVSGVARDQGEDHAYVTGGGHEHSKSRGLENEVNSAPLGNTSTTPRSELRDNTYNTSSGSTGLNRGSGLTGHNTTSTGTTGFNNGSGLTGSSGTHGISGENRLGQTSELGNTNTNSRVL